jgi:hypothetical protein
MGPAQIGDGNLQVNQYTTPREDPVESAASDLVRRELKQWRTEARNRGLFKPTPLPVPWKADQEYSDHLKLTGAVPDASGSRIDAFTAAFLALRGKRLVILGEAGTGKTTLALMLMIGLLQEWRPGKPVPVMLSLGSWAPERDNLNLDTWLKQQLTVNHPVLKSGLLSELVDARRILPVLDGLDELAKAKRPEALLALNRAFVEGSSPMILTCRTTAYHDAVLGADVLRLSAVVEANALPPATVATALADYVTPPHADRWRLALDEVRGNPAGPLVRALSTPLMLWLLKAAYQNPTTKPGELVNLNQRAIEEHLLDSLVPAVFQFHPELDGRAAVRRWPEAKAERWLGFLASAMTARSTSSLQWWDLKGIADPWLVPALIGITFGTPVAMAAVVGALVGVPNGSSLWIGLLTALAFALGPRYITRMWFRAGNEDGKTGRRLGAGLVGGLIGGLAGAAAAGVGAKHGIGYAASLATGMPAGALIGISTGASAGFTSALTGSLIGSFAAASLPARFLGTVWTGVPAGLINGLGIGLATALAVASLGRREPAWQRREWKPRVGVPGGAAVGLGIGLAAGLDIGSAAVGIVIGLVTAVMAALPIGLSPTQVDLDDGLSPGQTLRADARAFRVTACAAGLAAGTVGFFVGGFLTSLFYGPHRASALAIIAAGLRVGLAAGLVLGLTFGFYHAASPRFYIVSWWLALRRRAPWRLARFLDDAREKGVLRQAGPTWEFRHDLLKDHLAAKTRTGSSHEQHAKSGHP